MRNQLLMAVAVAALIGAPALAQETGQPDPASPPPSIDPIGTPPTVEPPAPTPDTTDVVQPATPEETQPAQTVQADSNDIVDVLREQGQFTTLVSALEATGLTRLLETDPDITILAPSDAAFAALPAGEVDRLMAEESRDELRQLLLYHVINADVRPDMLTNRRGPVETGSGVQILLDGGEGQLRADAAAITNAELRGSNGAVMVIDRVLNPDASLAGQGDVEDAAEVEAPAETETPAEPPAEEGETIPNPPPTVDMPDQPDETAPEVPAEPQA